MRFFFVALWLLTAVPHADRGYDRKNKTNIENH